MCQLSDDAFEAHYKSFLAVRSEWEVIVRTLSIYNDESPDGEPVRHIAMTDDKAAITRAGELLRQWQQFADIAHARRQTGAHACSPSIYSPVPVIVDQFTTCSINEFSATSVNKIRREDLLAKLKKKISNAKRNKGRLTSPYNIPELERNFLMFSSYPEGTIFRMRIGGYVDIFIDFFDAENGGTSRERVGQYGILVDSTRARKANKNAQFWGINNGSRIQYASVYDTLTPIQCSLYANCEIYLLEEVERAKKQIKEKAKIQTRIKARNRYHEKKIILENRENPEH